MTAGIPHKADIAEMLDGYAAATGDGDWRRAASALRGKFRCGRPKSDDDAAVNEAKLMAAESGLPVLTASRHVAKTITSQTFAQSTARRLARKIAAQNNLSAAQNILSVDLESGDA